MSDQLNAGLRGLQDPLVIAAFSGWSDAGNAASAAVEHLAEAYQAELAFELDPEDFYDYQVNRPEVAIDPETGDREITWPTTRLKTAQLPDGRDLVLIDGIEPNLRWRQFGGLITSALRSARPQRAFVLGALLADTPHTRPVPVTSTTRDITLMETYGLAESTYEGPTGITGVMADLLTRAGIPTVSVWAAIPHYVSHPPCPKATLAILSQLERLLDVSLDVGELPELARAWERGVNELAADDSEVAEYVSQLEEQTDATDLPEASGDAIAAEFERYLKRRQGG
jgi:predicted ATP-grasp superfamily ATP-dependent carboligase